MNTFFLFFLVCISLVVWYRINEVTLHILKIRKALVIMSENIATLDLVKKLARAVVNAQESEQDAEEARAEAISALSDLQSQVTLDDEATELISRALGNAVHAPAETGEPIDTNLDGIPDSEQNVDETPAPTNGIDVSAATADTADTDTDNNPKPAPPSES